ncbi:hypothetical protein [Ammoniphilus sp. YIM 78166]|uniref:hypothetical protein n=1 Tax=Ammoniphilus sp. YIM 78166 TaxID=1644106 RepID=UPI001070363D|nr:hypothetical protein [Ammoniphilus sp. YIM 78166]
MFGVLGILAVSAIISFREIQILRKQNMKRDLWAFCFFMLLATGMMAAEVLALPIPNPMEGLAAIFSPISGWFMME